MFGFLVLKPEIMTGSWTIFLATGLPSFDTVPTCFHQQTRPYSVQFISYLQLS